MKYDLILFDADNTLFDFSRSEAVAFRKTILSHGVSDADAERCLTVYHAINKAIWKEMDDGLITQSELKTERFRRLASALDLSFDPQVFSLEYMRHLADASFLFDDTEATVERLSFSHKLFIVTNGLIAVQEKRVKRSTIARFFEKIVVSEEVGVAKPDPQIFALALEDYRNYDKTKILMVGDGLATDIQGAVNYGMDTCWMNLFGSENTTGLVPTYEISVLSELLSIVEQ